MTSDVSQISKLPIVDVAPLVTGAGDRSRVATEIGQACRDSGFFYIVGHGIDARLQQQLEESSRRFFAQDFATKMEIAMERGGRAWRGYFAVGAELTSGKPDVKEGIYFGPSCPRITRASRTGRRSTARTCFPATCPIFETQSS